jgi:hypothetical protein
MLTWWLATALAAQPANVTPDAAEVYEKASGALLTGPMGCWEVVGRASYRWDAGRFGYATGDAIFVGRLNEGVWEGFLVRSLGEDQQWRAQMPRHVFPHDESRFVPLVGKFKSRQVDLDHDGLGDNVLDAAFDKLGTDVDYSWSEWDDRRSGVVLHRAVPFGEDTDAPEATMSVFFPGGALLPENVDVQFPQSFSVPGLRLARVKNATAHVRGKVAGGQVFPEAETFSFDVGFLGVAGTAAQSIAYQSFRPCGGTTKAEAKAVGR